MYELIYRCYRGNHSCEYNIVILCRMKSMDEIIDNVVVKYNIPLEEDPIENCYKDGFWYFIFYCLYNRNMFSNKLNVIIKLWE